MAYRRILPFLLALILTFAAACPGVAVQELPEELQTLSNMGFPMELQSALTGKKIAEILNCFVAYAAPDQLESWKALCPNLAASDEPLLRIDAVTALFLAVQHVGGAYMEDAFAGDYLPDVQAAMYTDSERLNLDLFGGSFDRYGTFDMGIYGVDHFGSAACNYNWLNPSPLDGQYPFSSDENGSFRNAELATCEDALWAVARVIALAQSRPVPVEESVIPPAELTCDAIDPLDAVYEGGRVVVNGIVHQMDIRVSGPYWYLSAQDVEALFGDTMTGAYVCMDALAREKDIGYTQDEILRAAYFSTRRSYDADEGIEGFEDLAAAMALPLDPISQETISAREMDQLLDCFVAYAAPEKLESWQTLCPEFSESDALLTRIDALTAVFLAVQHVGGVYMEDAFEGAHMITVQSAMSIGAEDLNLDLFGGDYDRYGAFDMGIYGVDHFASAACNYNCLNPCVLDGQYPLARDRNGSFRNGEPATYHDGVMAVLRVAVKGSLAMVPVDDPRVCAPSSALSADLIALSNENPTITAENHPRYTGMILNGEQEFSLSEVPDKMVHCANWGFNSVRLNLQYEQLFDRTITQANMSGFYALDRIVATAIEYNLHLNICMMSQPGRWAGMGGEFVNIGEFDLFINAEKQEQADRLHRVLAERYQDIPSDYLSFTPIWENMNSNLSTDQPKPDYTADDVGRYLAHVMDVIRAEDPDRMIIAEVYERTITESDHNAQTIYGYIRETENVVASFNYGDNAFIYANMTAAAGRSIDDENHSFYLIDYPTYFYALNNYIVDSDADFLFDVIGHDFEDSGSLRMDGLLPEGTVIDLYLSQSYGGTLQAIADGQVIYEEALGNETFVTGETISGAINYAASEKCVRIVLDRDTQMLEIAMPGGAVRWSGMQVHLPERYAIDRWYCATAYDAYLGLEAEAGVRQVRTSDIMIWPYDDCKVNSLTIHEDMRYSTPLVFNSAERKNTEMTAQTITELVPRAVMRFEDASFASVLYDAEARYYDTLLDVFGQYNLGWYSNDWRDLTTVSDAVVGASYEVYAEYSTFNVDLLRLLQKYQCSDRK